MTRSGEETKLQHVYQLLHGQIAGGRLKPGERLPTEQELSEQLGYSRATVATAVRMLVDKGLVERRKRVGSFVRAREEATGSLLFGAMIRHALPVEKSDNVFIPASQEIGHQAELAGYALVVHDPARKVTDRRALLERIDQITEQFITRNVAGVFVLPHEIESGEDESVSVRATDALAARHIPVVLLDRDVYRHPRRSRFDLVRMDNERAAYVLARHLIELGCRRIDFVALSHYASAQDDRVGGYLRALWDAGIATERKRVHYVHHQRESLAGVLRGSDAEAFVAVNDGVAADLMQAALSLGKRVPDDVRIVGFDDLPQSRYLSSPLTSIRQPGDEIGGAAVRVMFDRMKNPTRPPVDVMVGFELIVRESCGAGLAGKVTG